MHAGATDINGSTNIYLGLVLTRRAVFARRRGSGSRPGWPVGTSRTRGTRARCGSYPWVRASYVIHASTSCFIVCYTVLYMHQSLVLSQPPLSLYVAGPLSRALFFHTRSTCCGVLARDTRGVSRIHILTHMYKGLLIGKTLRQHTFNRILASNAIRTLSNAIRTIMIGKTLNTPSVAYLPATQIVHSEAPVVCIDVCICICICQISLIVTLHIHVQISCS